MLPALRAAAGAVVAANSAVIIKNVNLFIEKLLLGGMAVNKEPFSAKNRETGYRRRVYGRLPH
jgi:hypothetical protein